MDWSITDEMCQCTFMTQEEEKSGEDISSDAAT